MKKNLNFVVPNGYVGYSRLSKRVYNAGQWINPLTVVLVDIRANTVLESYTGTFHFKTRESFNATLNYQAIYSPVKENIKDFCTYFGIENFKQRIDAYIDASSTMYLSTTHLYEIKEAESINEAKNIICAELEKQVEKEISEKVAEFFPFLNVSIKINSISMELPESYM
jgi:hypothetical protein